MKLIQVRNQFADTFHLENPFSSVRQAHIMLFNLTEQNVKFQKSQRSLTKSDQPPSTDQYSADSFFINMYNVDVDQSPICHEYITSMGCYGNIILGGTGAM